MIAKKTVALLVVIAALFGMAVGYFAHKQMFWPMHVILTVGSFSGRILENSANLSQLKRNNVSCVEEGLESRIRSDLEQVEFYRNLAASGDPRNITSIDRASEAAREVLAMPKSKTIESMKSCR